MKSIYPKDENGEYEVIATFINTTLVYVERIEIRHYENGEMVLRKGQPVYTSLMKQSHRDMAHIYQTASLAMNDIVPPIKNKRTRKK